MATLRSGWVRPHLPVLAGAIAAFVLCAALPGQAQSPPLPVERAYDIPAQPLSLALAAYARLSGVDILYEETLSAGRTSSPVRGTYSPQAALRALLAGAGLSARFTQPKAAIIHSVSTSTDAPMSRAAVAGTPSLHLDMAEVRAAATIGAPDLGGYQRYAQAVQIDIRRRLVQAPELKGQAFRLQVAVTVDARGNVGRVTLLRGSGDHGRDTYIRRVLLGVILPPPPEGLRDALNFELTADPVERRG